jgi:two-component system response regulator NreC
VTTVRAPIRVVLAEDHTIVREGLRALLDVRDDIEVVAEVADGRAAVEVRRRAQARRRRDGPRHARAQRRRRDPPDPQGPPADPGPDPVDARRRGVRPPGDPRRRQRLPAQGLRPVRPRLAIQAVARGDAFFSPAIAKIVLHESRRTDRPAKDPSPGDALTNREREILQLVAEGKSSPEIAKQLQLSVKTVEGHRGRIMAKLDVHHVAGLVRHAIRIGLVSADS